MSNDSHDIIVLDLDKERLKYVDTHLDVIVKRVDSASFEAQRSVKVELCDIFIAATDLQNTNLTSCLIAKKLGAKKTIARINNPEYLLRKNKLAIQRLGVDELISPEELASKEIYNLVEESGFNETHFFEDGQLNLFGVLLEQNKSIVGRSIREVAEIMGKDPDFVPVAIVRQEEGEYKTIIPRGENVIFLANDQVYFLAKKNCTKGIYSLLEKSQEVLKDIIILGGGRIGKKTAELLKKSNHSLKIIEQDKDRAFDLADEMKNILVVNGDGRDADLLDEEGISEVDAFIAVTGLSETNIMSCLLAKSKGVKKTIALVENIDYIHLSQEAGIDAFINKKLLAANYLSKYIRSGEVVEVTSLSDLGAEVLEFKVTEGSLVANKEIKNLNFPKEAIIGGIIRKNKGYIASPDFSINVGDKIVVVSCLVSIHAVEQFFVNEKN